MLVMGFVIATAVLVMSGITPVWSGIGGWDFFGVPPKPWLYTGYLSALVATMLWIRSKKHPARRWMIFYLCTSFIVYSLALVTSWFFGRR